MASTFKRGVCAAVDIDRGGVHGDLALPRAIAMDFGCYRDSLSSGDAVFVVIIWYIPDTLPIFADIVAAHGGGKAPYAGALLIGRASPPAGKAG